MEIYCVLGLILLGWCSRVFAVCTPSMHLLHERETYRCARYYLGYHNEYQILWGLAIGAVFGVFVYVLAEFIPTRRPHSLLGRFKTFLLINPVSTWFQLRDGWAVWPDGGREDEWVRWRIRWDQQRKRGFNRDKRMA